jgi:hypothetical protein
MYLIFLEKEEQMKFQIHKGKMEEDQKKINGVEIKRTKRTNERKSWFFEKINNTEKQLK